MNLEKIFESRTPIFENILSNVKIFIELSIMIIFSRDQFSGNGIVLGCENKKTHVSGVSVMPTLF